MLEAAKIVAAAPEPVEVDLAQGPDETPAGEAASAVGPAQGEADGASQ